MDERIPAALARLWRLPTESRRGRPAQLDVEQVVYAAIELADREGLSGVTLSKVAHALGFTKMSLYRHVGSKDELVTLMADLACSPVPELPTGNQWRSGLRQWALTQLDISKRHPWFARVPIAGPPAGPNQIAWLDAGLQVLRETGLDWSEKLGIISVMGGYVRNLSQQTQDLEHSRRDTGIDQAQVERNYGLTLARLVDPQRFPEAAQLFGSDVFESAPPTPDDLPADHDILFGIELILDGVAAAIAAKRP